jgi:UDP-glucose 4-epimerase
MKALVLGGAGYIGGTTAHLLVEAGHDVLVIDNLSTGHKSYTGNIPLREFDILDYQKLSATMADFQPDVVLHFAAKIQVAESMEKPEDYFENNTRGTMLVLQAMAKNNIPAIVFSSTAAVYGQVKKVPINEDDPKAPINPYGLSKYLSEQLIDSYGQTKNINWTVFRYFNAAGAYKNIAMDYPVMTHLIPHATEAVLGNETLQVFGDDYDTPDGTCVRDFVHVEDIARAHLIAAEKMFSGNIIRQAMNLGSGSGNSVFEIINTLEQVSGKTVPRKMSPRRAGDPSTLISDITRAQNNLDWEPQKSINEMIKSHYSWRIELE